MGRYSPTDWFFAIALATVVAGGAIGYFALGPVRGTPIMKGVVYLVAASIIVNLFRYYRAVIELRKRRDTHR